MGLVDRFKRNRAVRRYAAELPRRLYRDYGAAAFYTPAQIATATRKLKLDSAVLVYGYAMFLTEDAFNAMPADIPKPLCYANARAVFIASMPHRPPSSGHFYESEIGFNAASIPDSGPGHSGF